MASEFSNTKIIGDLDKSNFGGLMGVKASSRMDLRKSKRRGNGMFETNSIEKFSCKGKQRNEAVTIEKLRSREVLLSVFLLLHKKQFFWLHLHRDLFKALS